MRLPVPNTPRMSRGVIAFLFFLLSFPLIGEPIQSGLDGSYFFACNYFFAHGIQFGKDVFFAYGPLGFLAMPEPIGNNLLYAGVILTLIKFFYIYLYYSLASAINPRKPALNLLLTFFVSVVHELGFELFLITGTLLLLARNRNNANYRYCAAFLAAVAILIKSSFGILSLILLFSDILVLALETKNIGRTLREGAKVLGLWTASTLAIWFALYHNFNGLFGYFYAMSLFASGNSSAMTVNPPLHWWLLALSAGLLFAIPLFVRKNEMLSLYAMYLLTLFAAWKYAVSRIDHLPGFSSYLYLFILLVIPYAAYSRRRLVAAASLSFLSYYVFNAVVVLHGYEPPRYLDVAADTIMHAYRNPFRHVKPPAELRQLSRRNVNASVIGSPMREIIGTSSIDIYPWELSYVPANDLNWRTRPVLQSYVAYEPWFDRKDAAFFRSDRAPQYLLWDHLDMRSIDERYLLNDEPETALTILQNYRLRAVDGKLALLERQTEPNLLSTDVAQETASHWGQWIKIPPNVQGDVITARVSFRRTALGSLKKLLYKEDDYTIEYRTELGETKRFRLVVDNSVQGLFISPLITNIAADGYQCQQVTEFRLIHSPDDRLDPAITVNWNAYRARASGIALRDTLNSVAAVQRVALPSEAPGSVEFCVDSIFHNERRRRCVIAGWAIIHGKIAQDNKLCIVLKSNKQTYVLNSETVKRPDITEHFKECNYDDSGYRAIIDKNAIEPGTYELGLFLVNAKEKRFVLTGQHIVLEKE